MQVISIAVSAILIVAGLVAAPGLINSARDTNAKGDIVNLAKGMEVYHANVGGYPNDVKQLIDGKDVGIKTVISDGATAQIVPNTRNVDSWCLSVRSRSGTWFSRISESTKIHSGTSLKSSLSSLECSGMDTSQLGDWANWNLSGGAYIDGDELVLPNIDSWAYSPKVWARPYTASNLKFEINLPAGGKYLTGAGYFGSDGVTPARNNGDWTSNGHSADAGPGSGWRSSASGVGNVTGEVEWVSYSLGVSTSYGVAGTRYKNVSVDFFGSK